MPQFIIKDMKKEDVKLAIIHQVGYRDYENDQHKLILWQVNR